MNNAKLSRASVVNISAMLLAVASGHTLGRVAPQDFGANITVCGILAGIVLLFIAGFRSPERQRLGVFCLWGYAGLFALLDPIAFIGRASSDVRVVPVLLLVPVVVATVALSRRRNWLPTFATWLFLFAAVLAMSYNVHHGGSGLSLLSGGWVGLGG